MINKIGDSMKINNRGKRNVHYLNLVNSTQGDNEMVEGMIMGGRRKN